MKRSQYGTIEQYVTAFRDAVQRANNLDLQITPWCAATLLLEELSKELPNWAAAVECAWPKDIHKRMAPQDWQQLCQDAIDRGRDYGSQMAAPKIPKESPLHTPSTDSKKFPNDKNRDVRPTEIGRPPPPGRDPEEYAREMREKRLSFKRCCGYCGKEGHHTGICYHLMIKKPRFYEPNEEIWCYIAETKPQGDISTSPTPPASSLQTTAIEMPENMRRFCGSAVAANAEGAMKIASDLIGQIMPKMVDMIFESIEVRLDGYVRQRVQTLSEPLERLEQRQARQTLQNQLQQAADIRPEVELEFARNDFQHHIDLLTSPPKPRAPVEPRFQSQRQEEIYDFDATDDPLLDSVPQDLEPPDPPTLRVTTTVNKGLKPERHGQEQTKLGDAGNRGTERGSQRPAKGGVRGLRLSSMAMPISSRPRLQANKILIPKSYKQAKESLQADEWRISMQQQISKLLGKDTCM